MCNINHIKQQIREQTQEMNTSEYVEYMRELAMWAEDEANLAEYAPEYNSYED